MTTVLKRAGQKAKVVTQIKTGEKHHHGLVVLRKRATGNVRPMRFVSLHHHSTFSYLDGYQLPSAHVRRATELQMGALAMTEHGNIDSHVKFDAACEDSGVKPLFGCEVYMPTTSVTKEGETVEWDSPAARTQRKHHLTILAKNAEGYANLLQIITKSWQNFYHEPTVTWDLLREHKAGIVVLSGCQGSLLFCSTVGGKGIEPEDASFKRGLAVARRFAREFDDYYVEVQAFPELEKSRQFNALAGSIARKVGVRLVATMDCHYTLLEEKEVQKILHNLRPGNRQTIEEQAREWGYNAPLCPPPNDNTILRRLTASGLTREEAVEAVQSTADIAEACTVELPKLDIVRFPVPAGYPDAVSYWRKLLKEGWRFRGLHRLPPARRRLYQEQLKVEMQLIESKDFVDYFLLVSAGVRMIKGKGIPVGPARGSAAASVAAWLLQITEVDPLNPAFGGLLQFERFISVDREDLPDIDLDFPSEARPLLRDFYAAMGLSVANIGTFIYFKNKMAVDDVARVFSVPRPSVETLKGFLIERSSGDMRASSTIEDTAEMFPAAAEVFEQFPDLKKSQWIEGMVKGFGVHAAGLALSNAPITSVTSVATRKVNDIPVQVVALDKYDAERQGVLKMDFLGLNTMSMIWDCIRRIGMSLKELYALPLDDPAVYRRFQEVDTAGVFQFEGRAMRYVCATLKPEKFSEVMDCNALARPGPLHNGAPKTYAEIKHGGRVVEAAHPAIADITAPTQHQIIYQEQVLKIARDVGGFGRTMVADIRRLISRKKGEQEFNRRRDDFLKGTRELHKRTDYPPMDDDTALMIWGDMVTSGAYAFNAAHCASYGLLAYWTMWLKVYHPDVFFAAQLAESSKDKERHRYLLRDAAHHGIRVLTPSLKRSEASWAPVRKRGHPLSPPTVRAGFSQVEGIGEKTAARVVEWRDETNPEVWSELMDLKGFGEKTVAKIRAWLDDDDPFGAFKLDRDIEQVKKELRSGRLGPLPTPSHNARDLAQDQHQGRALQVVWLGTMVRRNIRDLFEQNRARGHELDITKVKDPHLSEWALLTGEDESDQLLITVDRWKYPHFREALFNFRMGHDLLLIQATKPARSAVRKLNVKKLWVISPDDDE
jgi:DNA polymerase III subunit alpha